MSKFINARRASRGCKLALSLLLTVGALRAQSAAPAAQQPAVQPAPLTIASDSEIRAIIKDRVDTRRSAGIVVGVLMPDGSRRIIGYGPAHADGSGTLDGNSVFEIGSITKVFTASLLSDMVARGEVSLDDPVSKYLPATVTIPSRSGKAITLLDLTTQSSGLPRMPSNFKPKDAGNPYADYSVPQMYEFLSGYSLPRDPGALYEYSNLGVGLLGHALSLRAGKSYEDAVSDRVLKPLKMNDTRITLNKDMQARLAPGHDPMGNVVPNWDLPTLAGAGALRSTTNDMLTFLAANLDSTGKPLGAVLHRTHAALRPTTIPNMQIGLNWHIASRNGSTVVWHNGGTGGYRTFIGLDQSRRLAVVVLTNSGGAGGDDIGFHILVPSSPLATLPPAPKARTAITLDTTMLDHYLGAYELAPGVILTVTRDGSQLFVQLTGQEKIAAFAESEGEFFLKIVDAQLSFVKDSTGAIGSAVLHQNGANQTMKRMNK